MISIDVADGLVFSEQDRLYTVSLNPGTRVYGERLISVSGSEYRDWDPTRSKLSAYLKNGGRCLPLKKNSNILYLGASSGTTASHVSDMLTEGKVYCVEFAPRMFRDLLGTCSQRPNMVPVLGNAMNPMEYQFAVGPVDIVYSDVAQKRQADIIADNADMFGAKYGMVAIKARSEDVTSNPSDVFRASEKRLEKRGFEILDSVDLEPYEISHRMIVFRRS